MKNQEVMLHNKNDVSTVSLVLDGDKMATIFKLAEFMSKGVSTVPKHLQGNSADCMAVIIQASQWGLNPFAVAQKTHLINGVLGYEAQLVNSVLQTTKIVKGVFNYEYKGGGDSLECRVGAKTKDSGEDILYGEWLKTSDVTIKNSPLWKTNPKQQIGYLQVKNWARKYYPSAILGVYTDDEIEPSNINNQSTKVNNTDTQNAYAELIDKDNENIVEVNEEEMSPVHKLLNIMKDYGITSKENMRSFSDFHKINSKDPETFEHILDDFEGHFTDWQNALLNDVELV